MSRVRGFLSWKPYAKTLPLLGGIERILKEYLDFWPLTCRQVFYRAVALALVAKDEKGYDRVAEILNRARRSGRISFAAIRDDGITEIAPPHFSGPSDFWAAVERAADEYLLDRQQGQAQHLEVWVEAAGMASQLARAIEKFDVPVLSSGGFDSTTVKHATAQRYANLDVPAVVLHVGDHDPSGVANFVALAEDVSAFVEGLGGAPPTFERVAVTSEQIAAYPLPTAPAKASDKRSAWNGGGTVQAEALPPDELNGIVRGAVERWIDLDIHAAVVERERTERERLLDTIPRRS